MFRKGSDQHKCDAGQKDGTEIVKFEKEGMLFPNEVADCKEHAKNQCATQSLWQIYPERKDSPQTEYSCNKCPAVLPSA